MKKTVLSTVIASTILIGSAAISAQDAKQFDGLYGGIETGVDWTRLAGDTKRDRSLYYGGIIGLRTQLDNGFVFGAEGTFGDSGYDNNALGIKSEYEWSTSLIFGSAIGDGSNLVYGKVGYAKTRFNPAVGENFSDDGLRLGGGYERSLNDNLSLRISGDYTTYGNDVGQWQSKAGLILKF